MVLYISIIDWLEEEAKDPRGEQANVCLEQFAGEGVLSMPILGLCTYSFTIQEWISAHG